MNEASYAHILLASACREALRQAFRQVQGLESIEGLRAVSSVEWPRSLGGELHPNFYFVAILFAKPHGDDYFNGY